MNADPSDSRLAAEASAAITIGQSGEALRALWLQPQTQARIWSHFADVVAADDGSAEWIARGPAGGEYRWHTDLQAGDDDLRWTSNAGGDIPNAGRLAFRPAPGDRGTELHLGVRFDPPGGMIGEAATKLFHIVPHEIVRKALYKFRALALTGEIPTTDPQPAARNGGTDH